MLEAEAIVVGAGLAGLAATAELAESGRRVLLIDQEPEASLGGQAHWAFGGLFLVDSPEQRRTGIRDSLDLALQDWLGSAGFDRDVDDPTGEDHWARQWATAYVDFACGEKRAWLREMGHRVFPVVGWAERGGYTATGHGNSVPRFHITWGTGPGIVEPFERRVRDAAARGLVRIATRHQVDEILTSGGTVTGVRGTLLEPTAVQRGELPPHIKAFIARNEDKQKPTAAKFDATELTINYNLLQVWDMMSLYICQNETLTPDIIDPVPTDYSGKHAAMRLTPLGDNTVMLDPYPFDQPSLTTNIVHRQLTQNKFKDEDELQAVYFRTVPQTMAFKFVPKH